MGLRAADMTGLLCTVCSDSFVSLVSACPEGCRAEGRAKGRAEEGTEGRAKGRAEEGTEGRAEGGAEESGTADTDPDCS